MEVGGKGELGTGKMTAGWLARLEHALQGRVVRTDGNHFRRSTEAQTKYLGENSAESQNSWILVVCDNVKIRK